MIAFIIKSILFYCTVSQQSIPQNLNSFWVYLSNSHAGLFVMHILHSYFNRVVT